MPNEDDLVSRREFLAGAGALAAASLMPSSLVAATAGSAAGPLGSWFEDAHGMPGFHYTGPLRFPGSPAFEGEPTLPDDPYFLTGNYRLTLFTHASGAVQILTAERGWGRVNQGHAAFSGANQAHIQIDSSSHSLIGMDSPASAAASKHFGVGFARYDYDLPSLSVTRQLSVQPSLRLGEGTSAFLVQVRLHNTGSRALPVQYDESVLGHYQQIFASWNEPRSMPTWPAEDPEKSGRTIFVRFTPQTRQPMAFPPPGQMSLLEQHPPALFVHAMDTDMTLNSHADPGGSAGIASHWLGAEWAGTIQPGHTRTLSFIVGYSRDTSPFALDTLTSGFSPAPAMTKTPASSFGTAWLAVVPAFASEPDPVLRREMRWNAAVLESMAIWREYYNETIVPQGTEYDYQWGMLGSMRDQAQHALPFCHFHPAIARSTLRFIMKRTLPDGYIMLNDYGFGWSPRGAQETSDQQLWFFILLAEYLRVTHDTSILTEQLGYYPLENSGNDTGLAHVRQAFLFLRDQVSVGQHGLVLRWNSDWNDMFGWWPSTIPYNTEFGVSESHMNSAMASVILGDLAEELETAHVPNSAEVAAAMRAYRASLADAFMKDLGNRGFSRRAYLDAQTPLGENNMWLEPQGFALQIPELSMDRRRRLFAEVQHRLLPGESQGARQIEHPSPRPGTPAGSRENGGFWYALNGPLILGVNTFDRPAAESLLRRMTFTHYAETFPHYWTGLWTAADSLNSSLLPSEGLAQIMPWCAHAHAWPLYCWFRLRETPHPA